MDATFRIELQDAFIARDDDLRKLLRLLTDRIGPATLEADCSDAITRKFPSIKDLLEYDNPRSKEIKRLRIVSWSDDVKKRAEVDFYGNNYTNISIRIDAREEVVGRLKGDVLDALGAMRPAYWKLCRYDFTFTFFLMLVGFLFILFLLDAVGIIEVAKPANPGPAAALGTIVPILTIAFGFIINRLRESVFPHKYFAIGQAKRRLETIEKIQWNILAAFIVSVIASVAVTVWYGWFS